MPAPTLIAYGETTWNAVGSPKSASAVSWLNGDLIVVLGGAEGNDAITVANQLGLTFTAGTAIGADSTHCWANSWSATATSNQTAVQVAASNASSVINWGVGVWVFRGHGGIGNRGTDVTTAKTVSLTRAGANSLVVFGGFDFAAAATTGYSFTPAVANDRQHVQVGSNYSVYVADFGDQGAAGTTSYGIAGTPTPGAFSKIALEVEGLPGGGGPLPQPGGQAWRRLYRRPQQFPPPPAAAVAAAVQPVNAAITMRIPAGRRQPRQFLTPGTRVPPPVPVTLRQAPPRVRRQPAQRLAAGMLRGLGLSGIPPAGHIRARQPRAVPLRAVSRILPGQRGSLTVPVPVPVVLRHRQHVLTARSRLIPSPFAPAGVTYQPLAQRTQFIRPAWRLVRQPRQRITTGMLRGLGLSGIPPSSFTRSRQAPAVPPRARNNRVTPGAPGSLTVPVPVPVVLRHRQKIRPVPCRLTAGILPSAVSQPVMRQQARLRPVICRLVRRPRGTLTAGIVPPPPPAFTIGTLTAAGRASGVLTAAGAGSTLSASTAPAAALTAATQKTGGPS